MRLNKVTTVFFSPTGGSKRSANAVARGTGLPAREVDLTIRRFNPTEVRFPADELAVLAAPVYCGRLPEGAVERFRRVHGDNTPCIVLVTYGNRNYDDALIELFDLAKEQGFVPVAAAALVARHTYGRVQLGRPDVQDMAEDEAFGAAVARRLENEGVVPLETVPGNRPYRDGTNPRPFIPQTGPGCTMCQVCVHRCPEGAIDPVHPARVDGTKCISCFRCIRFCPEAAKRMDTPAYTEFAMAFSERLAVPRENLYLH